MGQLFLFMMLSLDGFYEGPNHELDWHNVDAEFNEFAIQQLKEIDTLLFGRKTYEMMASYWPTEMAKKNDPAVAKLMNSLPKIVFSRRLANAEWHNTRVVRQNVHDEIVKLKARTDKDLAIFGSSNLCVSLIQAGLIDELRIMVNPVVLGKGHTLFAGLLDKVRLELLATRMFGSGNVLLYYKVLG